MAYTIPDLHSAIEPILCWSGAFTDEEINEIIIMGDNLEFQQAKVGNIDIGSENLDIRNSVISWVTPNDTNSWLFNKMAEIISKINAEKYQFKLSHFESFQYTTYTEGGYYKWHIDSDSKSTYGPGHRKLGVSVVLSDPETEFTGGEFQIIPEGNPEQVNSTIVKKGDILIFPSFVPHQVTTVLSGKRKSLVCWVLGPKFK